ncbi:unnamed protein product [Cylindrotheca closterium]|uniref:DDE Tnp4 domain-containing protein n=1 Tax=Cylindrotheca closterium TaxID=2856 RepID=A0AAD2CSA8_9STRA|nr:unnamed protein product [Cylindrotheca closterium]
MRIDVSEEVFFHLGGLAHCLHAPSRISSTCKETNEKRFKDAYFATAKSVHDIFLGIQHPDLGRKRIKNPKPTHLLLALRFLKQYPTKETLAGFGGVTEKTALLRCWKYVEAIQALKEQKIVWLFGDTEKYQEVCVASVDGVHFCIWEPRKFPSAKWYSPKYKKAGLAYEIGVAVHHNKIVWVNGPFPAGENDKKIFDKPDGLRSKLKDGQQCVADQGYRGNLDKVVICNSRHDSQTKDVMERAKARQESVNSRLKNFRVLRMPFRTVGAQRLRKHKTVLEACLVIIQFELDNESRLMKV